MSKGVKTIRGPRIDTGGASAADAGAGAVEVAAAVDVAGAAGAAAAVLRQEGVASTARGGW